MRADFRKYIDVCVAVCEFRGGQFEQLVRWKRGFLFGCRGIAVILCRIVGWFIFGFLGPVAIELRWLCLP